MAFLGDELSCFMKLAQRVEKKTPCDFIPHARVGVVLVVHQLDRRGGVGVVRRVVVEA